jgi:hypothetical protein
MPTVPIELPAPLRTRLLNMVATDRPSSAIVPGSPEWPAFEEYLIWSKESDELQKSLNITQDECFLHRYYWLSRVANIRSNQHGPDEGLQQNIFDLFQEAEAHGVRIDWAVVEALTQRAKEDRPESE